jgi:hypothetical protein
MGKPRHQHSGGIQVLGILISWMTGRRLQGKIGGLLCGGATYSVQLSSRATKPSGVTITRQFDTDSRVEHHPKLLGRSVGGGCAKLKWILVSRSPQHVGYIVYKYWARDWRLEIGDWRLEIGAVFRSTYSGAHVPGRGCCGLSRKAPMYQGSLAP